MSLVVSLHAYERARERLGYTGTREALAAVVEGYRGTQAGLDFAGSAGWKIKIPQERMIAVIRNGNIVTIFGMGPRKG